MKKIRNILTILIAALLFAPQISARKVSSVRSGDWYDAAVWSGGIVPSNNDEVTLLHYMTFTSNIQDVSLTITEFASLVSETSSLRINTHNYLYVYGYLEVYNLQMDNAGPVYIASGVEVLVYNDMAIKNNSDELIIDGSITVTNNFSNGNNGIVSGDGEICVGGFYYGAGTTFGVIPTDTWEGGTCARQTVLPVSLVSFNADRRKNHVEINWITATELNNEYFEVQKSTDGVIFNMVERIKGEGNSNKLIKYSFNDYDVNNSKVYYRLEQFDFDGRSSFSKIVSVLPYTTTTGTFNVVSIPSTKELKIETAIDNTSSQVNIEIFGLTGQLLFSQNIEGAVENLSSFRINQPDLNRGIYIVRVSDSGSANQAQVFIP